jgi:polysaccharide export outer membrane protein
MVMYRVVLFAMGCCAAVFAQAPAKPALPVAGAAAVEAESSTYRISPGDLLDVQFPYNPELNARVQVRPDGAVAVSSAGEFKAAGLTPAELAKSVEQKLARKYRYPEAAVGVVEFAGNRVFVGGEVHTPQALNLRGTLTCLQAVMAAGGPRPSARLSEVLLLRYKGDGQADIRQVDLARVLKGKGNDLALRPYDVIMVPKSRVARVAQYVDSYVNSMVPRSLVFPYNLNNTITYNVQ